MADSIIYNRLKETQAFIFSIPNEQLATTYGIIATEIAIEESETSFTTTTVGGDVYIYCTGQKPVNISLSGCILDPKQAEDKKCYGNNDKDFRKFYEGHRIGKQGNEPVRMTIGGDAFTGCLYGYSRKASSLPTDSDVFSFKFVGVKNATDNT